MQLLKCFLKCFQFLLPSKSCKKPPSKVDQNISNPLFFPYCLSCPNGPNRRIHVPKCDLKINLSRTGDKILKKSAHMYVFNFQIENPVFTIFVSKEQRMKEAENHFALIAYELYKRQTSITSLQLTDLGLNQVRAKRDDAL